MNRVVLDAELKAKLRGGGADVDFVDESGNLVGHYLPKDEYMRLMYDLAKASISKEEIAEARKEMLEHGGVSSEEILETLAKAKREWETRKRATG